MSVNNIDGGKISTNSVRFVINYVVRFFSTVILVYSCWIPFQNLGSWFSYHVILCTFGYIPLMAEAIMMFVGDDIWSLQLSRKAKYNVHALVITLSTAVVIVGNALVFHYISPGFHLYTAHGITGLVSMIILIISVLLGFAVSYPDQSRKLLAVKLVWYKLNHNVFGLIGYGIGIVSLCLGFYTNWFKFYYGEESRLAALIITVIVSVWPVNGAVISAYYQIKSVFS